MEKSLSSYIIMNDDTVIFLTIRDISKKSGHQPSGCFLVSWQSDGFTPIVMISNQWIWRGTLFSSHIGISSSRIGWNNAGSIPYCGIPSGNSSSMAIGAPWASWRYDVRRENDQKGGIVQQTMSGCQRVIWDIWVCGFDVGFSFYLPNHWKEDPSLLQNAHPHFGSPSAITVGEHSVPEAPQNDQRGRRTWGNISPHLPIKWTVREPVKPCQATKQIKLFAEMHLGIFRSFSQQPSFSNTSFSISDLPILHDSCNHL